MRTVFKNVEFKIQKMLFKERYRLTEFICNKGESVECLVMDISKEEYERIRQEYLPYK